MDTFLSLRFTRFSSRLLFRGYNLTYGQIGDMIREKSHDLRDSGIKRGDRVILSQHNHPSFLIKLGAIWRCGATACLIPPHLSPEKKKYCQHVVLKKKTVSSDEEDAIVFFTSGTSSLYPKGVILTHENLVSHVSALDTHIPEQLLTSSDTTFSFLPWTHCYGLMGECMSVVSRGASMDLYTHSSRAFSFPRFWYGLQWSRPTILMTIPRLLESLSSLFLTSPSFSLLSPSTKRSLLFGSRLRYIVSGGASLSPEIRRQWYHDTGLPIHQGYGCTEMSPMISFQTSFDEHDTSVGKILPHVKVSFKEQEICVNGPARMKGYLHEETGECVVMNPTDFFETKDLGHMTPDKMLYVTGRHGATIKLSNGRFVSCSEIEDDIRRYFNIQNGVHVCVYRPTGYPEMIAVIEGQNQDTIRRVTFYGDTISVHSVEPHFFSIDHGTLSVKGEVCRRVVQEKMSERLKMS